MEDTYSIFHALHNILLRYPWQETACFFCCGGYAEQLFLKSHIDIAVCQIDLQLATGFVFIFCWQRLLQQL